jgi:ketosteroid isomerase-like protein
MSQENVELAYRAYAALNGRDLDALLAVMDPGVELKARFMEMEGGAYFRGHSGVREWWDRLLAIFPDFRVEVIEIRDFGDRVIAALRVRGHGLDSGVPIDQEVWQASRVRDGRVTWWRNFESETEALEAAELTE